MEMQLNKQLYATLKRKSSISLYNYKFYKFSFRFSQLLLQPENGVVIKIFPTISCICNNNGKYCKEYLENLNI